MPTSDYNSGKEMDRRRSYKYQKRISDATKIVSHASSGHPTKPKKVLYSTNFA